MMMMVMVKAIVSTGASSCECFFLSLLCNEEQSKWGEYTYSQIHTHTHIYGGTPEECKFPATEANAFGLPSNQTTVAHIDRLQALLHDDMQQAGSKIKYHFRCGGSGRSGGKARFRARVCESAFMSSSREQRLSWCAEKSSSMSEVLPTPECSSVPYRDRVYHCEGY